MPHCRLWSAFALDVLDVAARFTEGGSVSWCTELRHRAKAMGTTHDARVAARIRYVDPVSTPPASVVALDGFRDL